MGNTEPAETIIASACLLGVKCRYDGAHTRREELTRLLTRYTLITVCPEVMGGLPVPRPPVEIVGGRAVTKEGEDRTARFKLGAQKILALAKKYNVKKALLKAHSPSCGCGRIYDGTFTGKLVPGNGITADLLEQNGITVFTEQEHDRLMK